MFVTLRDGLRLHVRVQGEGGPLLLLHGFTGSVETWGEEQLQGLAQGHRVLAVDFLGHGGSDPSADPERFRVEEILRDLLFDLPSRTDVREVVVTKEAVEDAVPPLLVLHPETEKKEA